MGVRENKVETYLHDEVTAIGGSTRKFISPGHDSVPDRIIFVGMIIFVEVKTIDGRLTPAQRREQSRLRKLGALVTTVYGRAGVDSLLDYLATWNEQDALPKKFT